MQRETKGRPQPGRSSVGQGGAAPSGKRREPKLDYWVRERPIRTFLVLAGVGTFAYWALRDWAGRDVDFLKLGNDSLTDYIGYGLTSVVALAGALVTVMLARLALKLGHEAKETAEQANDIQSRLSSFSNPEHKALRDGHEAVASLDLLGTVLRQYSGETFVAPQADRPVGPVRDIFKRANDRIADPNLFLYAAQLMDVASAARHITDIQSLVFDSNRNLDQKNYTEAARGIERVAVEIAKFSRRIELTKSEVLVQREHRLHALAHELRWESLVGRLNGCESTARADFNAAAEAGEWSELPAVDALGEPGTRAVVHVLETELDGFVQAMRDGSKGCTVVQLKDAAEPEEGLRGTVLVVADWDSIIVNSPREIAQNERDAYSRAFQSQLPEVEGIESKTLWGKATFLANQPAFDNVVSLVLKDLGFLRGLRLQSIGDEVEQTFWMNDADPEIVEGIERKAHESARLLGLIHGAVAKLRALASGNTVTAPEGSCYGSLRNPAATDAIILVRPFFARIDMQLPHSEWEQHDEWFQNFIVGYTHYRWKA